MSVLLIEMIFLKMISKSNSFNLHKIQINISPRNQFQTSIKNQCIPA